MNNVCKLSAENTGDDKKWGSTTLDTDQCYCVGRLVAREASPSQLGSRVAREASPIATVRLAR